jgi:hypothetical protein
MSKVLDEISIFEVSVASECPSQDRASQNMSAETERTQIMFTYLSEYTVVVCLHRGDTAAHRKAIPVGSCVSTINRFIRPVQQLYTAPLLHHDRFLGRFHPNSQYSALLRHVSGASLQ